jgi:beta-phosphoglucomutase-like phosphatase (HAD superfamily)
MLAAVLFELEGVLVDTVSARRGALHESLAPEGITFSDAEYLELCHGLDTHETVRATAALHGVVLDETAVDLATLRAERSFAARMSRGMALAAGATALLEAVSAHTRLGLVTRANRRETQEILSVASLAHLFECVVTRTDVSNGLPSPESYQMAIERLERRRPLRAGGVRIAVSDSRPAFAAARAAGLRCVAAGPMPAHHAVAADGFIPSLVGVSPADLERLAGSSRPAALPEDPIS